MSWMSTYPLCNCTNYYRYESLDVSHLQNTVTLHLTLMVKVNLLFTAWFNYLFPLLAMTCWGMKSSTCTKTPALRFLIKICVPYLGLAVLRAPAGVTNTGRNERKLWGNQKSEWVLIMLLIQHFVNSFLVVSQPSASKLCMLFWAEIDVCLLLKTEGSFL